MSISRDRNMSYMYRSKPEILSYTPFHFSYTAPLMLTFQLPILECNVYTCMNPMIPQYPSMYYIYLYEPNDTTVSKYVLYIPVWTQLYHSI